MKVDSVAEARPQQQCFGWRDGVAQECCLQGKGFNPGARHITPTTRALCTGIPALSDPIPNSSPNNTIVIVHCLLGQFGLCPNYLAIQLSNMSLQHFTGVSQVCYIYVNLNNIAISHMLYGFSLVTWYCFLQTYLSFILRYCRYYQFFAALPWCILKSVVQYTTFICWQGRLPCYKIFAWGGLQWSLSYQQCRLC